VALAANPVRTEADRAAYESLLAAAGTRIDAMRARLAWQAERRIRMAKIQIPRVAAALRGIRRESSAWNDFHGKLAGLPVEEQTAFLARVDAAIAGFDRSLDALIADLEGIHAANASAKVGLAQYPGGREYYRHLVKRHTTLDTTPEELRALGRRLLRENSRQLDSLADRLGVTGGHAGLRDYANRNPKFIANTPEEMESRYTACMVRIEPKMPAFFQHLPQAPYRIRRIDASQEGGVTFGYYQEPLANQPYGEYRYNGSALAERSLIAACALMYHELLPGHHYHAASQMENDALPAFRRVASGLTAFNEGWAEYASNLAGEMGVYENPDDLLGRLMLNQMMFSRLVVDVGLNYDGWSLERARRFMRENTFLSATEIDSETLRYSADLPGQALAYGAGYHAFGELRLAMQAKLGDRFDIRRFHTEVIRHGAMPLSVLRGQVERALTENSGEPAP
jgi:uncharacterized protein (DUF885 family)